MNLNEIFRDITESFNSLWQTKVRGKSLEIITPFASTNNKFVSVFISYQKGDFIISDGGWLNGKVYENDPQIEDPYFQKILYHYQNAYGIKEVASPDGIKYYYLKATNSIDIPSRVFDLSSFLQSLVSVSLISFEEKAEKESKARFIKKANDYLKSFLHKEKIKFNQCLDPEMKELKFNAIVSKKSSKVILLNYVTGSTFTHFSNSIFKANTLFEMIDETNYQTFVSDKVSLVDTSASGFIPEKISHYLLHLERQTGSKMVNWNEKERLQSILN